MNQSLWQISAFCFNDRGQRELRMRKLRVVTDGPSIYQALNDALKSTSPRIASIQECVYQGEVIMGEKS
jgi:hypothetical protein